MLTLLTELKWPSIFVAELTQYGHPIFTL